MTPPASPKDPPPPSRRWVTFRVAAACAFAATMGVTLYQAAVVSWLPSPSPTPLWDVSGALPPLSVHHRDPLGREGAAWVWESAGNGRQQPSRVVLTAKDCNVYHLITESLLPYLVQRGARPPGVDAPITHIDLSFSPSWTGPDNCGSLDVDMAANGFLASMLRAAAAAANVAPVEVSLGYRRPQWSDFWWRPSAAFHMEHPVRTCSEHRQQAGWGPVCDQALRRLSRGLRSTLTAVCGEPPPADNRIVVLNRNQGKPRAIDEGLDLLAGALRAVSPTVDVLTYSPDVCVLWGAVANARLLVSPHGFQLSSILMLPPGAAIMSLQTPVWPMVLYTTFALPLGMDFGWMNGAPLGGGHLPDMCDYRGDIDCRKALRSQRIAVDPGTAANVTAVAQRLLADPQPGQRKPRLVLVAGANGSPQPDPPGTF